MRCLSWVSDVVCRPFPEPEVASTLYRIDEVLGALVFADLQLLEICLVHYVLGAERV